MCNINFLITLYVQNLPIMNKTILFGILLMNGLGIFAQDIPDQNPNYEKMIVKYSAIADSFTNLESSTIQRTYKAYDWYEAKMQAKAERKAFRRELRLIEAKNTQYYYNYDGYGYGYNGYYNYPFYSSSYYPNQYGYYGNNYRNNWSQSIVPPLIGAAVGSAATIGMYHLLRRR